MPIAAPLAARAIAVALGVSLAASAALAESKPAEKSKTEAAKPELIGSYGDWSVFHSQSGKAKICYTLAQPKSRDPEELKRDPGYAFISERPGEGVRNEVSFIMGFDVAAGGGEAESEGKDKKKKKVEIIAPTAAIGDANFDLLPKGANLWVKNAAQESSLVSEMRKGKTLVIKAASKKGSVTTDTYSLSGFSQAIDRAMKDCPGG